MEDGRLSGMRAGMAAAPLDGGLWSHDCGWADLLVPVSLVDGLDKLDLAEGWASRWTATWSSGGDPVSCVVRDLAQTSVLDGGPTRWFSWRRSQRHRPGLHFLVSTGRHHGAESLEEARVLLALDFAGGLVDVIAQPVKFRFDAGGKRREHTPDFLAVTLAGVWLVDVRPKALIKGSDLEAFAAAAEIALACGWHYVVAVQWRENVVAAVDAFSSQRRALSDPLGLRLGLLEAARQGGTFGELADATPFPPVARAQLLHLLWHRQAGIDLRRPFGDQSFVIRSTGPDS
ncbi:TnsA-like heteromeric transposase endonuclease subunit [Streptomyces sp. NBC_01077]|uniref:TnsA-like heteromeric transposase endonuclease subunit n=1 Tax=Streptomyces sp. NBC_01077 TaxID=2903746 RepID=UPI00386B7915|nr:TnsA-like heteromeric transposase endonuclease subunit [Streptomyces sp. NBC_01077]WSV43820.1 TnsA-like heteromeric transposase endonuclease subunit [Streptomyces sp. NBC_01077]